MVGSRLKIRGDKSAIKSDKRRKNGDDQENLED